MTAPWPCGTTTGGGARFEDSEVWLDIALRALASLQGVLRSSRGPYHVGV